MLYSPYLANTLLQEAFREEAKVVPMKLQRLTYILACEAGRLLGEGALLDPFAPWDYGPVSPSLHAAFLPYSNPARPIRAYAKDARGKGQVLEDPVASLARRVWRTYGEFSPGDLSDALRGPQSAWRKAWEGRAPFLLAEDMVQDTSYRALL